MALTEINREIGQRIRAEREKKNLTREAFAELINMSASFVADMERGKSAPSAETLITLSQVLDVSIDTLFFGIGHKGDYSAITRHLDKLPTEKLEDMEKIISCIVESLSLIHI